MPSIHINPLARFKWDRNSETLRILCGYDCRGEIGAFQFSRVGDGYLTWVLLPPYLREDPTRPGHWVIANHSRRKYRPSPRRPYLLSPDMAGRVVSRRFTTADVDGDRRLCAQINEPPGRITLLIERDAYGRVRSCNNEKRVTDLPLWCECSMKKRHMSKITIGASSTMSVEGANALLQMAYEALLDTSKDGMSLQIGPAWLRALRTLRERAER